MNGKDIKIRLIQLDKKLVDLARDAEIPLSTLNYHVNDYSGKGIPQEMMDKINAQIEKWEEVPNAE